MIKDFNVESKILGALPTEMEDSRADYLLSQ